MNKKIEKKIVGYKVVSEDQEAAVEAQAQCARVISSRCTKKFPVRKLLLAALIK